MELVCQEQCAMVSERNTIIHEGSMWLVSYLSSNFCFRNVNAGTLTTSSTQDGLDEKILELQNLLAPVNGVRVIVKLQNLGGTSE